MKSRKRWLALLLCVLLLAAPAVLAYAGDAAPAQPEHIWEQTVKKATTKEDGIVTSVCKLCGETKTETVDQVASIELSQTSAVYNGKKQVPQVIVTDAAGKTLKKGTDYKVKYSGGCKKLGVYTVTVTLTGNYRGSKKLTFRIVPTAPTKLKATSSNQKVTLSWQKVAGATGYVIYSASKKNGTYRKLAQTEKTTWTSKKYKPGRAMYFKVKAVCETEGQSVESALSKVAGVKVALPNTVYVTRTGTKFHLATCETLRDSKIAISLSDAKQRGYTACSRCIG